MKTKEILSKYEMVWRMDVQQPWQVKLNRKSNGTNPGIEIYCIDVARDTEKPDICSTNGSRSKPSSESDCGYQKQTATHIFKECPSRLLHGGMKELYSYDKSVPRTRFVNTTIWKRPTKLLLTICLHRASYTSK